MNSLRRRLIQAMAERARIVARTDAVEGERLYQEALSEAKAVAGKDSPLVGEILLGLHDLYEQQGRNDAAEPVWEQIRHILVSQLQRMQEQSGEAGLAGRRIQGIAENPRGE